MLLLLLLLDPQVLVVVEELLQERVETELLKLFGHDCFRKDVDLALFTLTLDKYMLIIGLLHPHMIGFRILVCFFREAHAHLHIAMSVVKMMQMI